MLSQRNINKLNLNAIYKCKPNKKCRGKLFEDDLYHCCNWTFEVIKTKDGYYMRDTYWRGQDSLYIKLTDDNFSIFTLVFDKDEVIYISESAKNSYEKGDVFSIAIDSGGWRYPKHLKMKHAKKSKNKLIEVIDNEIFDYEQKIKSLKHNRKYLMDQDEVPSWY
ncbi:hypothetical protein ACQKNX_07645 [Lysinibacillus sp. NPDC093712]|uniref:hypothetical protein n=1 Tax=Lysinibacillus sp. NPDC093712 TaxID=3390579 RepID=UPI003D08ED89